MLTLLMWAVLGFCRFFHLEDFRHQADLGLALFTGRMKLLSDSTLWRLVHTVKPESEVAFYRTTAAETIHPNDPDSAGVVSFDDHVVPSFTAPPGQDKGAHTGEVLSSRTVGIEVTSSRSLWKTLI